MTTESSLVEQSKSPAVQPPTTRANNDSPATAHDAAPAKPSLLWMVVPVLLIAVALFLAR